MLQMLQAGFQRLDSLPRFEAVPNNGVLQHLQQVASASPRIDPVLARDVADVACVRVIREITLLTLFPLFHSLIFCIPHTQATSATAAFWSLAGQ